MKKIAVLISGSGSNLEAIINSCIENKINGEIKCVISNMPDAYGLKRAKKYNLETRIINHKNFLNRQEFDLAIEEYLDKLEKKISTNFQTSKLVTKEIAKIGNQKAKDSLMGKFPSHTKVRNIYFATLNSIITLGDVSEMICEGLLNIIFKLDLRKYTDKVAAFKNESFHFTLITGVGMLILKLDTAL